MFIEATPISPGTLTTFVNLRQPLFEREAIRRDVSVIEAIGELNWEPWSHWNEVVQTAGTKSPYYEDKTDGKYAKCDVPHLSSTLMVHYS